MTEEKPTPRIILVDEFGNDVVDEADEVYIRERERQLEDEERLRYLRLRMEHEVITVHTEIDPALSLRDVFHLIGGERKFVTDEEGILDHMLDRKNPKAKKKQTTVYFWPVKKFRSIRSMSYTYARNCVFPDLRAVANVHLDDSSFAKYYPNNVWLPGYGFASFYWYHGKLEVVIHRDGASFLRNGHLVDIKDWGWHSGVKID